MKSPKPRQLFKALTVFIFLAFLSTCKKDINIASQQVADPDIVHARSWYQSSFSANSLSGSTSGNKSTSSTSRPIYNLNKLIKTDWSRAVKYSRFNKNVIELPADSGGKFSFDLKNATTNQIYSDKKYSRTSLLILSQGSNYEAYIMMVLADPSYIKNDPNKINNNTYRKHDPDFTGTVMYFTPNGNYVSGYAYNNGQMIFGSGSMINNQQTQSVNKLKINEVDVETCTDWYYDTYVNDQLVSSEYLYTTCTSGSSSGGSGGGAAPTPPPCADTTSTEAATSTGHLIVNVAQPTPQPIGDPGSGDGGFPPPDTGCNVSGTSTPTFGLNHSNAIIPDGNFDAFLNYVESVNCSFDDPIANISATVDGVNYYPGELTLIYNTQGQVVSRYFSPDETAGPFTVGMEYNLGNGELNTGVATGNAPSDYPEFVPSFPDNGNNITTTSPLDVASNSSNSNVTGGSGGTTGSASSSEGFRPLCKSSIVLTPSSSNTSEVNMMGVQFGIMDMPHFPLYKTEINVITFNLYISIPNQITNPTDRTKTVTITPAMQQEFIYLAYHFASQQVNIAHGDDFFSAGAQSKYSKMFAADVMYYLNYIALQGMFPAYENANSGSVPSLGARSSTLITSSKATPAVYTNGTSGEGC